MSVNDVVSGYLDVKISSKSRRGLTPWKAWQRQWCEIKRLDSIESGLELTLKTSSDGTVLNYVILPRSSTICRTESRSKQYAFGVFTLGRNQKPLLFLSGVSESDSQEWMSSIRKMLCIASYLRVGKSNFHISLVDSPHSRAVGLIGLHGVLGTNKQEIVISDPCTGEPILTWKWYQFHQFHLQASAHPSDEKMICVLHTSSEFPNGAGQLYFYCKEAPRLLDHLVARGKSLLQHDSNLILSRRLSRSEGDLCVNTAVVASGGSPVCLRSHSGSDDSGVRVSVGSDDLGNCGIKNKVCSSLLSLGMGVLSKTPGGSETNTDSVQDLSIAANEKNNALPRPESGVSLASGVYEEIPETPTDTTHIKSSNNHIYENLDLSKLQAAKPDEILNDPPPLPRRNDTGTYTLTPKMIGRILTPYKQRCNTLPAKDLSRVSQTFTPESEYVIMTPTKTAMTESLYMPMSPAASFKSKLENCYMAMSGRKT